MLRGLPRGTSVARGGGMLWPPPFPTPLRLHAPLTEGLLQGRRCPGQEEKQRGGRGRRGRDPRLAEGG